MGISDMFEFFDDRPFSLAELAQTYISIRNEAEALVHRVDISDISDKQLKTFFESFMMDKNKGGTKPSNTVLRLAAYERASKDNKLSDPDYYDNPISRKGLFDCAVKAEELVKSRVDKLAKAINKGTLKTFIGIIYERLPKILGAYVMPWPIKKKISAKTQEFLSEHIEELIEQDNMRVEEILSTDLPDDVTEATLDDEFSDKGKTRWGDDIGLTNRYFINPTMELVKKALVPYVGSNIIPTMTDSEIESNEVPVETKHQERSNIHRSISQDNKPLSVEFWGSRDDKKEPASKKRKGGGK